MAIFNQVLLEDSTKLFLSRIAIANMMDAIFWVN
jgi:hypothetical protein